MQKLLYTLAVLLLLTACTKDITDDELPPAETDARAAILDKLSMTYKNGCSMESLNRTIFEDKSSGWKAVVHCKGDKSKHTHYAQISDDLQNFSEYHYGEVE